jgi:hypothetical protein
VIKTVSRCTRTGRKADPSAEGGTACKPADRFRERTSQAGFDNDALPMMACNDRVVADGRGDHR